MGITRSARSSLNPRERLPGVRSRGLSDDLGVYPAISWVTRRSRRPPRPDETPRTRTIVPGEKGSLKNALSSPAHASRAPPDTALRLAHVEDRTYVMRVQRDRIHPGSRHASSVRQNPPRRDSREPTSHNSSSGDMTNSTPPGGAVGRERRGCCQCRGRRRACTCTCAPMQRVLPVPGAAAPTSSVGDPRPRGCHRAGPVPEGRRTGWWPRRRRWGPCPLPGGTRSSGSVGESESGARPRRRRRAGAARESRHHRREARRWRRGSPARGNRSAAVVPGDSPALQK